MYDNSNEFSIFRHCCKRRPHGIVELSNSTDQRHGWNDRIVLIYGFFFSVTIKRWITNSCTENYVFYGIHMNV